MFCNAVVVSYMTINFDFGKHKDYLLPDNIPKVAVLGNISSTLVVTALCWSKTSFGMTLVRFTKSWTMAFIWLMVITMNMLFFWAALIQWIYCQPLDKVWDPNVEGTCWDHNAVVNVQITASGKLVSDTFLDVGVLLTTVPPTQHGPQLRILLLRFSPST